MKQLYFILFLHLALTSAALPQYYPRYKKIDSLFTILLHAKDIGRINCENELSLQYYVINTDSAWMFANNACTEADHLRYTQGKVRALINMGSIMRERFKLDSSLLFFRHAVQACDTNRELKEWGDANFFSGNALSLQGSFEEARSFYKKAMVYFEQKQDKENASLQYRGISDTYSQQGHYDSAFEYQKKALAIGSTTKDAYKNGSSSYYWSNEYLAETYLGVGDTVMALTYFYAGAQRAKETGLDDFYYESLGKIFLIANKPDSARHYFELRNYYFKQRCPDSTISHNFIAYGNIYIGETYLMQKQYDKALENLLQILQLVTRANMQVAVMMILKKVIKVYESQKKSALSFAYARRLLQIAEKTGARQYIQDGTESCWRFYDKRGKTDSAYKYLWQYVKIKDVIAEDKQLRYIALLEMTAKDEQLQLPLDMLNQGIKIKQQQLEKESFQKKVLLGGFLFLFLLSFIIIRYNLLRRNNERLENEQKQAQLRHKTAELEMQALRSQMNPHFIFNCLSSINRFILKNETEVASDYLTKFSRLIRMVLTHSKEEFITLEDELNMLRFYLDMERLRFKDSFSYDIVVMKDIEPDGVSIPPLLLQPFAENAIWHGLMNKEGPGSLCIAVCIADNMLQCMITDNGVGRKRAAELKSRSVENKKSMGLQIAAERLALLNTGNTGNAIEVEDLYDATGHASGTRVILNIKLMRRT